LQCQVLSTFGLSEAPLCNTRNTSINVIKAKSKLVNLKKATKLSLQKNKAFLIGKIGHKESQMVSIQFGQGAILNKSFWIRPF
jgi:4-hydroxy-3-methylbut-2-enyl diphosphate reductase IspH